MLEINTPLKNKTILVFSHSSMERLGARLLLIIKPSVVVSVVTPYQKKWSKNLFTIIMSNKLIDSYLPRN